MNYVEISVRTADKALQDILIAQLAAVNYYGFAEDDDMFKAYINDADFDELELRSVLGPHGLDYTHATIAEQNWNELWESNFDPITVDDFAGIRAGFHEPLTQVQHEIIITPKMSFGTGHHATTWMMMKEMQGIDFTGKTVFDFGTGTGILAILAEKLGASGVLAIDYDEWCIENAAENLGTNQCKHITIEKGDNADVKQPFDIILANINRNIIEDNIEHLATNLSNNGVLLLSGLLMEDELPIVKQVEALGLKHIHTVNRNGWIAIRCEN